MEKDVTKIGLFGGTFNPIHYGHLRAALETRDAFDLDQVLMIPSARPPHKSAHQTAPGEHRLAMVRLGIESTPGLGLSDVEFGRKGPSYTVETIEQLQGRYDQTVSLSLIIGLDAFQEYDTWHRFRDLFKIVPIIVLLRPGNNVYNLLQASKVVGENLHLNISDQYRYQVSSSCFTHIHLQPVHLLEVTRLDISSSRIRGMIKAKKSIRFLLPERVAHYIERQRLYL